MYYNHGDEPAQIVFDQNSVAGQILISSSQAYIIKPSQTI